MKRKTLMVVLAVVVAALSTLVSEFGLAFPLAGIITFVVLMAAYIRGEAARDIAAIRQQSSKWSDPKFWTVIISAIVTALNNALRWSLPIDVINIILLAILGFLFKKKVATN